MAVHSVVSGASGAAQRLRENRRAQLVMTQPTSDAQPSTSDRSRVVLHAACTCPGVASGFTNLVVSKVDSQIMFDPHVTNACVFTLNVDEACVLRDALVRWLG
ncbi:MAG: hypothetical protein ACRDQI_00580 [Pseudonocardiaceae bacterium]